MNKLIDEEKTNLESGRTVANVNSVLKNHQKEKGEALKNILDGRQKTPIGKYVATHIDEEDIDDEIRTALDKVLFVL